MTYFVLFISLLAGVFLSEIALHAFGGQWFRIQLLEIVGILPKFREAVGDDARQALLLRSGFATLQFSLALLGLIVGLAAIAGLAPWGLEWMESQQTIYFVASSVVATFWWILRRPGRSASATADSI
jgi:hypothetical protein